MFELFLFYLIWWVSYQLFSHQAENIKKWTGDVNDSTSPLAIFTSSWNVFCLLSFNPFGTFTALTKCSLAPSFLSPKSETVSYFHVWLKLVRVGCLYQTNLSCLNLHTDDQNIELNYQIIPMFVCRSQQGPAWMTGESSRKRRDP